MEHRPGKAWSRFRHKVARAIGVVIVLCFCLVTYLEISASRERSKRRRTTRDFQTIVAAILSYYSTCRQFPRPVVYAESVADLSIDGSDSTRTPMYSWRFTIVHHIAGWQTDLPGDAAWSSSANKHWRVVPQPYAYGGWGDGLFDTRPPETVPTETRVFAVTGPGTAFGDGDEFAPFAIEDIDEDTILLLEIRKSGRHWMEPSDFDIRTMPRTICSADGHGISSVHDGGFHVAFSDGTVWWLSQEVPFESLAKFFTVEGAKANDRDIVLGPYRRDASSR